MKPILLSAIAALLATGAAACPWAGVSQKGTHQNLQFEFTMNEDCSEVVFQSTGNAGFQPADTPETFAVAPTEEGWAADINSVTTTFLKDGRWIDFIGSGVNLRVQTDG